MSRIYLFVVFALMSMRPAVAQQDNAAAPADNKAAQNAASNEAEAQASDAGAPAKQPADPSPASLAARAAFDEILQQYQSQEAEIRAIAEAREGKRGTEREALDQRLLEIRANVDKTIQDLAAAGAVVYETDPNAFPQVNQTVMAIAQFYLTGDQAGDRGDQYEKALPVIERMIEAGAAERWNYLNLWAGTAAVCTNQFDKAAQYFQAAREAGVLGSNPPVRNPSDPRYKIWDQASKFQGSVDSLRQAWEAEKKIRATEAQADDLPRVKLTTTKGPVIVELFENEAPETTASFLTLVKNGYYDGVVFHRVLPGFMAQGGDPTGTGSGGPGYNIRCECYRPDMRRHFRGSLSMANTGQRDTGGSQFFLTFVPTSFLDGKHTVFGRVVEGLDYAVSLKRRDPQRANPPAPDKIIKAEVLRDRGHEYQFEKLPER